MAQKKILFFILTGILFIGLMYGVYYISTKKKATKTAPKAMTIWITEGSTDDYKSIIDGFKKYAPDYAKTTINVEKQSNDPERYRTFLLSTLTEGNGPDLFMLRSGEDVILDDKVEPVPSDLLDFSNFEKTYDDLFLDLITYTGSSGTKKKYLKGVPVAYETLGVFYNKGLIREVPKTWNDVSLLYNDTKENTFPTNLGLGPTYTPNMVDTLPLWLEQNESSSYSDISKAKGGISDYISYSTLQVKTASTGTDVYSQSPTLESKKSKLLEDKETTLDSFMRGNIGLIVGYPSLALDLEKSDKRVGMDSVAKLILTDTIPQFSSKSRKNTGRYIYFGISKKTENGMASIKFLEYLMTPDAQRLFIKAYPYMIPAQSEFYASVADSELSSTLNRTKLAPFIPQVGDTVTVYNYGLKSRFNRYIQEGIDTVTSINIDALVNKIQKDIGCEVGLSTGQKDKMTGCEGE